MDLIEIYNTIVSYLGLPVPERFIELSGLFGLILATYGAFLLVGPLMRTDGDILKISQYETEGAVLGKGKSKKTNSLLQTLLQEDREIGFLGAKFIFGGFALQLLEKSINIVYPINNMPQGINWFSYIILIGSFIILISINLKKIRKKSDSYKTEELSNIKVDQRDNPKKEEKKTKLF